MFTCVCVCEYVVKKKYLHPSKEGNVQTKQGSSKEVPSSLTLQVAPLSEHVFLASKACELVVKSREKSLNSLVTRMSQGETGTGKEMC